MRKSFEIERGVRHTALAAGLAVALCPDVAGAQAGDPASAVPVRDTTLTAVETRAKSATTATLLSVFLPGAGYIYARETRTGVVLVTLFATGIAIGAAGENATSSPVALLVGPVHGTTASSTPTARSVGTTAALCKVRRVRRRRFAASRDSSRRSDRCSFPGAVAHPDSASGCV